VQSAFPEPLYTPAEAKRLRELIAKEAAGDAGRHPEGATWLAWAYAELADEAKIASRDEVRKILAGAVPVAPRTSPFTNANREPVLEFAKWAKGIADFRPQKYAEAVGRFPTK
jgi:hypothetical protein